MSIQFGNVGRWQDVASQLAQGVSDQCKNGFEKIVDRGARLDSLRCAPERLNVNFKRFLKTKDDTAATIKSRLNGASVKTRQLANVVGYCVQQSDKPSSECLKKLSGADLKEVLGECPREKTSFSESLRAKTEQVKYFVNKHVKRQESTALQGTLPTVKIVNARAKRNAHVDEINSARRQETAQALGRYVKSVGWHGAVTGIGSLINSDDFKEQVRSFPERVNSAENIVAGSSANSILEVTPKSSQVDSSQGVRRLGLEMFDCVRPSGQQSKTPMSLATIMEEVSDSQDNNSVASDDSVESVKLLASSAVPKSDEPSSNGAEKAVSTRDVSRQITKQVEPSEPVPALSPSATLAPNDNYRDWITIVGRVASLATLAALAYSYFASGSVESTALVPIS